MEQLQKRIRQKQNGPRVVGWSEIRVEGFVDLDGELLAREGGMGGTGRAKKRRRLLLAPGAASSCRSLSRRGVWREKRENMRLWYGYAVLCRDLRAKTMIGQGKGVIFSMIRDEQSTVTALCWLLPPAAARRTQSHVRVSSSVSTQMHLASGLWIQVQCTSHRARMKLFLLNSSTVFL
jgi:hypothetical protein